MKILKPSENKEDEQFQNYAQKCNITETEPEDQIPEKCQVLAIPDYNQPQRSEPELNQNLALSDQDIIKIIQECKQHNEEYMLTQQVKVQSAYTTATKQIVARKSSPKIPIFHNCQISGNITININKN